MVLYLRENLMCIVPACIISTKQIFTVTNMTHLDLALILTRHFDETEGPNSNYDINLIGSIGENKAASALPWTQ